MKTKSQSLMIELDKLWYYTTISKMIFVRLRILMMILTSL